MLLAIWSARIAPPYESTFVLLCSRRALRDMHGTHHSMPRRSRFTDNLRPIRSDIGLLALSRSPPVTNICTMSGLSVAQAKLWGALLEALLYGTNSKPSTSLQ